MSAKSKNEVVKDAVQALVVIDNFNDDFLPITQDLPLVITLCIVLDLYFYILMVGGVKAGSTFVKSCVVH